MSPFLLPRTVFDFDAMACLPHELHAAAKYHPLVIADAGIKSAGILGRVERVLEGTTFTTFASVTPNPTFFDVDAAHAVYRDDGCDAIIAVGGGSVIDTAKLVAVLASHGGKAADFVGRSEKVSVPTAFLICVPTTSGTGSESSPDAGIHPDATTASSGISSWRIVPSLAVLDPMLTLSLPPRLTAATGMDALSHCIEGYLSTTVSPMADMLALEGISRVVDNVEQATRDGTDRNARWNMMAASYAGGAAISKGLGPAHAVAISCSDRGFHHGMLSTIGLIGTLELVQEQAPEKCRKVAAAMNLQPGVNLADAVQDLCRRLELPDTLFSLGFRCDDLDGLARLAADSHFNLTSPCRLTALVYRNVFSNLLRPR